MKTPYRDLLYEIIAESVERRCRIFARWQTTYLYWGRSEKPYRSLGLGIGEATLFRMREIRIYWTISIVSKRSSVGKKAIVEKTGTEVKSQMIF